MSTDPAIGTYPERCAQEGVVKLYGSFQGNSTSDPTAAQSRGILFTATYVSAGLFKVTLTNPPSVVSAATATSNTGLHVEPKAWITSESETAATAPVKYCNVQCSRVNSAGAFHIWVYDIVGAALYTPTTADRVNFEFGWKATSFTP